MRMRRRWSHPMQFGLASSAGGYSAGVGRARQERVAGGQVHRSRCPEASRRTGRSLGRSSQALPLSYLPRAAPVEASCLSYPTSKGSNNRGDSSRTSASPTAGPAAPSSRRARRPGSASIEEMVPKAVLPNVVLGSLKAGWLRMLKTSARSSSSVSAELRDLDEVHVDVEVARVRARCCVRPCRRSPSSPARPGRRRD